MSDETESASAAPLPDWYEPTARKITEAAASVREVFCGDLFMARAGFSNEASARLMDYALISKADGQDDLTKEMGALAEDFFNVLHRVEMLSHHATRAMKQQLAKEAGYV